MRKCVAPSPWQLDSSERSNLPMECSEAVVRGGYDNVVVKKAMGRIWGLG